MTNSILKTIDIICRRAGTLYCIIISNHELLIPKFFGIFRWVSSTFQQSHFEALATHSCALFTCLRIWSALFRLLYVARYQKYFAKLIFFIRLAAMFNFHTNSSDLYLTRTRNLKQFHLNNEVANFSYEIDKSIMYTSIRKPSVDLLCFTTMDKLGHPKWSPFRWS